LSERHFLAVAERTAAVWEYTGEHVSKPALSALGSLEVAEGASVVGSGIGAAGVWESEQPSSGGYSRADSYGTGFGRAGVESGGSGFMKDSSVGGVNAFSLQSSYATGADVRKVLTIRNMPSDGSFTASTVMVSAFDQPIVGSGGIGGGGMLDKAGGAYGYGGGHGANSKPQHVLYCVHSHRLYVGRLPSFDVSPRDNVHLGPAAAAAGSGKEDLDELKLSQSYFTDRKGAKLTKSKLQITSTVLLPLRRLLLIGTDDGCVRVVA
jgi:hypothetical protein